MAEIIEITQRQFHILIVSSAIIIVLVLLLGIAIGKNISLPQRFPSATDIAQKAQLEDKSDEISNLRQRLDASSSDPFVKDEGHVFYEKLSPGQESALSTTTVIETFSPPQTDQPGTNANASLTEESSDVSKPTPDIYATAIPGFQIAYSIQTSSVANKSFAEDSVKKLTKKGYPAYISRIRFKTGKVNYRVRVGPYLSQEGANTMLERIKSDLKTTPLLVTLNDGDL